MDKRMTFTGSAPLTQLPLFTADQSRSSTDSLYSKRWLFPVTLVTITVILYHFSPANHLSAQPLLLLACTFLLGCLGEYSAVQFPQFGTYSVGAIFWLYLALSHSLPAWLSLVVAGLASFSLGIVRQAVSPLSSVKEIKNAQFWQLRFDTYTNLISFANAITIGTWLQQTYLPMNVTASHFFIQSCSLIVWGASQSIIPHLFNASSGRSQEIMDAQLRFSRVAGLNMGIIGIVWLLLEAQPPYIIWPAAGLAALALRNSAKILANNLMTLSQRRLQRQLHYTTKNLTKAQQSCQRTEAALHNKMDELSLQQLLPQCLCGANSLEELWKQALQTSRRLIKADSIIIFDCRQGHSRPVCFQSQQKQLLENWELVELHEPLVELVWQTQTSLPSSPATYHHSPTALVDEPQKLAFPLDNYGVLYAGRAQETWTNREEYALQALAKQLSLMWPECLELEQQNRAIVQLSESNDRLDKRAEKLEILLRGIRSTLKLDNPETLLDDIEKLADSVVPGDYLCLILNGPIASQAKAEALEYVRLPNIASDQPLQPAWKRRSSIIDQAMTEIHTAVCKNGRPLLIDRLEESRFAPPTPDTRSLLAVPIFSPNQPQKTLMLGAYRSCAFTREDQELMSLLAYHLSAIFHCHTLHQNLNAAHLKLNATHEELQNAHEQLQRSQTALLQSEKMAALGRLAAGLAHELNTPLGAIMLGIDSSLQIIFDNNPRKMQARLERACQAAQQAKTIISRLLCYARGSNGERQNCHLSTIIKTSLDLLGNQLKKSAIKVKVKISELPEIYANANELQQVFTNLLLNARDAVLENSSETAAEKNSPNYQPQIIIEAHNTEKGPEAIISDNGPGLSPEAATHLFEPFFTTKAVGQGTGLGLSVSLAIIHSHGGSLTWQRRSGYTNLIVRLPANGHQPLQT